MSTLRTTNIKNESSASNNIVLDSSGGVIISGVTTVSAGTTSIPSITPTGDSNTGIFFPSADTIAFTEAGVESLRIDSSGRVGIGTTNPQYNLDVVGNINFTGTFNQNGSLFVASRWTSGTGDDIYRLNGDVGIATTNPTSKLHVVGDVLITGVTTVSSIVESSSITLKENISPIENALDKILQLNPVTYDRKNNTSKNEAGLIAEEVNQILPNIVSKDSEGNPEGINYTKLSVYLIDAVKTLAQEVRDLKNGNS